MYTNTSRKASETLRKSLDIGLLPDIAQRILSFLYEQSNSRTRCEPSQCWMAAKLGVCTKTINRWIKYLSSQGYFVKINQGVKKRCLYIVARFTKSYFYGLGIKPFLWPILPRKPYPRKAALETAATANVHQYIYKVLNREKFVTLFEGTDTPLLLFYQAQRDAGQIPQNLSKSSHPPTDEDPPEQLLSCSCDLCLLC